MIHTFINKNSNDTLVLFHGTGGDEKDLLAIGEKIDSQANLLGLRGRINERGMNRFFKRLSPGVFDVENLIEETKYIYQFLINFIELHHLNKERLTFIGFSNGANMIGSMLYHYGQSFKVSILMHPMIPIKDFAVQSQANNKILITAGINDPLVSTDETKALYDILKDAGGDVELKLFHYGHQISRTEIDEIKLWYQKNKS
jgi:phospholipase/carboxylesterase